MRLFMKYRIYLAVLLVVIGVSGAVAFAHSQQSAEKRVESVPDSKTPEVQEEKEPLQSPSPKTDTPQGIATTSGTQVAAEANVAKTNEAVSNNSPVKIVAQVPILYYHSVLLEPGNELRMPPEQFAAQMKYLYENNYHVISLQQLYNNMQGKENLPEKPVVINFDDGYVDNYTNAFPILQKYKFVATVFMVSGYVDESGFLTSDQLRTLYSAGWTIGGHTQNHVDLSKTTATERSNELKNSRQALEAIIGQPIEYFAYPFGGFNNDVANMVKQDGYKMAVTTQKGWSNAKANPFLIKRVYCYANMGMAEFTRRITNPNY